MSEAQETLAVIRRTIELMEPDDRKRVEQAAEFFRASLDPPDPVLAGARTLGFALVGAELAVDAEP